MYCCGAGTAADTQYVKCKNNKFKNNKFKNNKFKNK